MRAKDVLLDSLESFTGTVVFVSHDRYFIDKLATRVFEIEGGEVRIFPGNYEDYLWRKAGGGAIPLETEIQAIPEPEESPLQQALEAARVKRINPIKLRQLQDRQSVIEEEVARLETEVAGHETALGQFVSLEETHRHTDLLTKRRAEIEALMAEWEQVAQTLETQT
jgi:ATP-binding cassette subfamily F protein 3